jgi:formate dehydrogenase major subunit
MRDLKGEQQYKLTAVQVSTTSGPTEWQEKYREFLEESRRIVIATDAAD